MTLTTNNFIGDFDMNTKSRLIAFLMAALFSSAVVFSGTASAAGDCNTASDTNTGWEIENDYND